MLRKIGELLLEWGELQPHELDEILHEQNRRYRAFGIIAAERFNVPQEAVWKAWAEQYAACCPRVEIAAQHRDPAAASEVSPEDARRLRLLPLRYQDGDLICVTSRANLPRALAFLDDGVETPALLWLADDEHALARALDEAYPPDAAGRRTA